MTITHSEDRLPAALESLSQNPRVTVRRSGCSRQRTASASSTGCSAPSAALDNPALDIAIQAANELDLPVLVYFSAISNFPSANLRHYYFLNQGLRDIEADLAERGISFIVRRPPGNSLEALLAEVGAAMVIGDENPCREPERWRRVLANRLKIPFWTVDADVLVPSNLFEKHFFALHFQAETLRPLSGLSCCNAGRRNRPGNGSAPQTSPASTFSTDVTQGWKDLDRSVKPVDYWTGGTHAALKRLKHFIDHGLANYPERRNQPEIDGTSQLSPYLHFGHISPLTIALAAQKALKARQGHADRLRLFHRRVDRLARTLGQLREVSCPITTLSSVPNPGRKRRCANTPETSETRSTPLEELEKAQTYDELWNASQMQMVNFGWMHNYMRMYWAKKILEWSPTPAVAFQNAVYLNDKYELDGRDPNGYAGIAWAIAGVHDRPWFDRPIFGTIRYMSGASTGKKFNSKQYIRNVMEPQPPIVAPNPA